MKIFEYSLQNRGVGIQYSVQKRPKNTNTLAGSLQTNCRRFVAQCPLQKQKTPRKRAFDLLIFAFVFFSVAIGLYLFFHGGNDKNVFVQFRNTSLYVIGDFP